jgi:tRNA A37 threonylcarbamoyladenosine dehydratase
MTGGETNAPLDPASDPLSDAAEPADLERRFGALRRLWGDSGYRRVRAARVAVVGIGGVGSWAAEALARCGVAELLLFDLDHVAESNINRQIQALGRTLGAAKIEAMAERIRDIHPGCQLTLVDDFVSPDNWPALLPRPVDVLIDACDQGRAKLAMARWALALGQPCVVVGAAGGKSRAHAVEIADLAEVTHDPMLARLRQQLRRDRREAAAPTRNKAGAARFGLDCVFSREPVLRPDGQCEVEGSLNCAGYGSNVMVTASFGMAAAARALERVRASAEPRS